MIRKIPTIFYPPILFFLIALSILPSTIGSMEFGSLKTIALTEEAIEDNTIDLAIPKRPAANPPGEGTEDGFPTLDFNDGTDESVFITFHLPYKYADGGLFRIHVDFFVDSAPENPADVVWGVEYKNLSHGDNFDFSAGTSTTTCTCPITTGTPANDKKTHRSIMLNLTTTDFVAHDIILLRLYRDADNAADNVTGDVRIMGIHVEHLIDKLGEPT